MRRAVEIAPKLFDGGVDWEGTFVDEHAPNILTDLPPAILNFPQYASGISSPSAAATLAAQNIQAAGYPPDIVSGTTSLWGLYNTSFWEVTQCQWQKRLDPTYDTYVSGTGTYNYVSRLSVSDVGAQLAAFATTGDIQRPLVTVAGTMDALLPIDHHARAYARKVAAVAESQDRGQGGGNDKHQPAYRLYEVQNGNHLELFQDIFTRSSNSSSLTRSAPSICLSRRSSAARRCRPISVFRAAARSPTRLCSRDTAQTFSCPKGPGARAERPVRRGLPSSPANSKTSPLRTAGETPMMPATASFPSRERPNYRPSKL